MTQQTTGFFPALARMERQFPPLARTREPFWRPQIPAPARDILVPAWNWRSIHECPEGARLLSLDANAAYIGAAGGVKVAHSHLTPTGGIDLPAPRDVLPGYYRVTVPYWAFSATLVHPLGNSTRVETETDVWIAAPTLVLLLELLEEGAIAELTILDSWTAQAHTTFRAWVDHLKGIRRDLMDAQHQAHPDGDRPADCECVPCTRLAEFKLGYSAAWSMMLTGERCKTRRPDWAHTVYAQHAATMWRKAWRYTATGCPVIAMGHTDEITVMEADLPEVMARPKPPFRIDATGYAIGALKPKSVEVATAEHTAGPTALYDDTDTGDLI
ncbi:hypothetical protein [Streptomyces sp. NPDC087787]|uniref:hypothetical protein n=1 Tax=Streptomyces sp. NPDC087787 TaxID=3365803 RepID=UPI0038241478